MSDGKIEQVPDKKGSHERVTGHATSVDTGRTVVPSSVGTTKGAQLGRDHTVAAASTMIMPDGSRVPVVPPAAGRPAQPCTVTVLPPLVAPTPSPASALMAEEDAAPGSNVALAFGPVVVAAEDAGLPPMVSVTLKSLPDEPVIRWRSRYHLVLVTPTTVVLVWDSRFKHADSPLLPIDTGDLTKLKMIVQPMSKADLPFSLDVADCGLSFVHESFEYFVFVRDTPESAEAVKPVAGAPVDVE